MANETMRELDYGSLHTISFIASASAVNNGPVIQLQNTSGRRQSLVLVSMVPNAPDIGGAFLIKVSRSASPATDPNGSIVAAASGVLHMPPYSGKANPVTVTIPDIDWTLPVSVASFEIAGNLTEYINESLGTHLDPLEYLFISYDANLVGAAKSLYCTLGLKDLMT